MNKFYKFLHVAIVMCLSWFGAITVLAANGDTTHLFHQWKPRAIGPAGMSGRVTAIDVVLQNSNIMYVGTASGGLWRSTSGGTAWEPIMDDQPVASVGAVKVYQKNPSIIYVGTGEGNPRNSHNAGNGMYKSLDGGRTWQRIGLENTRNIHRIIIHPDNPDVVTVAAVGSAWGDSKDRGVYKTVDGGKTWRNILFVNEKTGAADLVVDPVNPNKMFVAMWEHRRQPWIFNSGGKGSGIYYTYDGGETWKQITQKDGLPAGELGRCGLAIAPGKPSVVYALVEAKTNVLLRSNDGGHTWKKVADDDIGNRPFYYAEIYVDPQNENRVYNLFSLVTVSNDGGKTFETLLPYSRVHPDHHAWWIHPNDPDFLIDGNDGGIAISRDKGVTWQFVQNLPLGQFYHINVDNAFPYNVYGGMQDNGSWRGPGAVLRSGGIRNTYWEEVAFGDGFDVVPDNSDPRYCYAMWQGGNLQHIDIETGHSTYIRPASEDSTILRFNWNAAIAADPFKSTGIYFGSQFVHYSDNRGKSWKRISPDVTTNDTTKQQQDKSGGLTPDVTAAENFTTIVAIAPSPKQQGVIWVGTDDGNVQLTTDGGKTWQNCVSAIQGVPAGTWVPQIQASPFAAGEAVVVFDNHRRNDWTPYIYRTKDFGKTWQRIADSDDMYGAAQCFLFDTKEPNLMFAGTEFGLYYSLDGAATWKKWTKGMPSVPVADMALQSATNDLVIGTFGRAAYILDDIQPLRSLAKQQGKMPTQRGSILSASDGYLLSMKQAAGIRFSAEGEFYGDNRDWDPTLTLWIQPDTTKDTSKKFVHGSPDSLTVEIIDSQSKRVRMFKRTVQKGLQRIAWNCKRDGVRFPWAPKPEKEDIAPAGRDVLPGSYTAIITYQGISDSATLNVILDPRISAAQPALLECEAFLAETEGLITQATEVTDNIRLAQATVENIFRLFKDNKEATGDSVRSRSQAMKDSLKVLFEQVIAPEGKKGGIVRNEDAVASKIGEIAWKTDPWKAPGQTQQLLKQQAAQMLATWKKRTEEFFAGKWTEYRKFVQEANPQIFPAIGK